jgi:methylglyoxal synthase
MGLPSRLGWTYHCGAAEAISTAAEKDRPMDAQKRIALIAHDRKKAELVAWVTDHRAALARHLFWSTGTTGAHVLEACPDFRLTRLRSGPLGGDLLVFFTDPLSPLPHDVDVKALTRLATLYNVACATNRATADFLISSPCFDAPYSAPSGGGDGEPGT